MAIKAIQSMLFRKINDAIVFFDKFYIGEHPYLILYYIYFWLFAAKISIYSIELRLFRKINDAIVFFGKFYIGEHPYLFLFYNFFLIFLAFCC